MSLSHTTKMFSAWFKKSDFYSPQNLNSHHRLIREGQSQAISLFRRAVKHVPAYSDFLKSNGFNPRQIKTFSDFTSIPPTTKENYIEKYPASSRCWHGDLDQMHMISTSSGTTGNPNFWPRNLKHEIDGARIHELLFTNFFRTHRLSTLVVNGFAMGNWIAGTFTQASVNLVTWKGHHITLTTPGYSLDDVIQTLTHLAPEYQQTIITGHNPFLKEIVDVGTASGLDWKKIRPRFLGTGQAVTESWRDYLLQLTSNTDTYHTFINLYGSADASLMGFETPNSIHLRRMIVESGLAPALFSDPRLPSLFAYDPRLTYFESLEGQLCLTKDSGCPLIRYNIHDEGGLTSISDLSKKIKFRHSLPKLGAGSNWQFPLVYLYGRTKFMTKIYGANIYTEHVQHALDHPSLQPHLTGRFLLDTTFDHNHNPILICRVELNPNSIVSEKITLLVEKIFVQQVRNINREYDYVLKHMGSRVKPKIILHSHADRKYFPSGKVKKTA